MSVERERPEDYPETLRGLAERLTALDRLTDAKFITMRTVIDGEAQKVALALTASEKAISKAEAAADRRFEGVNEFRAQLTDQASTFMPRAEADARIHALTEKLDVETARIVEKITALDKSLTSRLDLSQGRGVGATSTYTYALAAVAALGTIVSLLLLIKPGT